jgi:curli biogenesis system outer membrane secretion channel CsgG
VVSGISIEALNQEAIMRRLWAVCFLGVLLALAAGAQGPKRRVAVLNFDYATVRSTSAAIFGTDQDIGKGIADLIVDRLVQDGTYSVIERKALDKIMAEQNFANSDRADPSSAARIGRILGVDAIIIGSITQFGRDDKSRGATGGLMSRVTGKYGVGDVKVNNSKAVVGISARMVNTETAEILAAARGTGASARSGAMLAGAGGGDVVGAGGVDMTSKNFGATIIGEAVNNAVQGLCTQLEQNSARLPAKTVSIEGLVADATGGVLVLNIGSKAGLKVGDRLTVKRKVREVRDPASGKILRSIEDSVGEVVITEVDEGSSVGKFNGAGAAKVGDVVRNQ